MREYIVKRIIISILILFIIASLNFVIFQVVSPVSPTRQLLDPAFTPEQREMLSREYGLLEPLHMRYAKYVRNMFTWNFGLSFLNRKPVAEQMAVLLPNTIMLLGSAMITTILIGIPIGIMAASRRGSKTDVGVIGAGLFTWAIPVFFIELLFMLIFSYYLYLWLGWGFPLRGIVSYPPPADPVTYIADIAFHLAVPVAALTIGGFGGWALYTRSLLIDALTQDYITTARAKGLHERTVLYKHAFRSTLPPIVTMIALGVPGIVTGAMITEYIFTLPGIGRWYLEALVGGDYPVVQSVLFIYAFLTIIANFIADLIYGVLDPRIRVGMRR